MTLRSVWDVRRRLVADRGGMTLVELLVVIAIVATLMALLPSAGRAVGPGGGPGHAVPQQSQADRPGHSAAGQL